LASFSKIFSLLFNRFRVRSLLKILAIKGERYPGFLLKHFVKAIATIEARLNGDIGNREFVVFSVERS